jgi:RNA polymerase primary sigma factor
MDEKYWKDLNKYPPLSRKEEKELIIKAKGGDRHAYNKVINSNLRFVVNVAKEYSKQGLELEDLIAYGNLGLCKGFEKFDSTKDVKLISYAVWWIRQAILEALNADTHLVKIPHSQIITKNMINRSRDRLEVKHQREIYDHEIEDDIGKKNSHSHMAIYSVVPLEKCFRNDDSTSIKNVIENTESLDPESELDHMSFISELEEILSDFEDRERSIIEYYYGIGIVRKMTLEEIGLEFGITRERVRQIKLKVLKKLQHVSRSSRLRPYLADLKSEMLNDISDR